MPSVERAFTPSGSPDAAHPLREGWCSSSDRSGACPPLFAPPASPSGAPRGSAPSGRCRCSLLSFGIHFCLLRRLADPGGGACPSAPARASCWRGIPFPVGSSSSSAPVSVAGSLPPPLGASSPVGEAAPPPFSFFFVPLSAALSLPVPLAPSRAASKKKKKKHQKKYID